MPYCSTRIQMVLENKKGSFEGDVSICRGCNSIPAPQPARIDFQQYLTQQIREVTSVGYIKRLKSALDSAATEFNKNHIESFLCICNQDNLSIQQNQNKDQI